MKKAALLLLLFTLSLPAAQAQGLPYDTQQNEGVCSYSETKGRKLTGVLASTAYLDESILSKLFHQRKNEEEGSNLIQEMPCCDESLFEKADCLYRHDIQEESGECTLTAEIMLVCQNCSTIVAMASPLPLEHSRGDQKYPGDCR